MLELPPIEKWSKHLTTFQYANHIPATGFGPIYFEAIQSDTHTVINLDLSKIVAYWKSNNRYQRSPNVTSYSHDIPFNAEPDRLLKFTRLLREGSALPPIYVDLGFRQTVGFTDGRHRTVLLYLAGYTSIVALVKKNEACTLGELLGTGSPDKRLYCNLSKPHMPKCRPPKIGAETV